MVKKKTAKRPAPPQPRQPYAKADNALFFAGPGASIYVIRNGGTAAGGGEPSPEAGGERPTITADGEDGSAAADAADGGDEKTPADAAGTMLVVGADSRPYLLPKSATVFIVSSSSSSGEGTTKGGKRRGKDRREGHGRGGRGEGRGPSHGPAALLRASLPDGCDGVVITGGVSVQRLLPDIRPPGQVRVAQYGQTRLDHP